MKKLLLSAVMFGIALIFMPSKAQAQYTVPYYNDMGYILAQRAAARAGARARYKKATARKKAKGRVVRRKKTRRVSSLYINEQRTKTASFLVKRADIV